MPVANRMGEAIRNGRIAPFSLLYKPGATKRQIWNSSTGSVMAKPTNSASEKSAKNFSNGLVTMNTVGRPLRSNTAIIGSARNR